jgi:hypothetical protein
MKSEQKSPCTLYGVVNVVPIDRNYVVIDAKMRLDKL